MKHRQTTALGRALRRTAALFLATITLWVVSLTAQPRQLGAALRSLARTPEAVSAVLSVELGLPASAPSHPAEGMDLWQRLASNQSPLLRAGGAAVAALEAGDEALLPEQPLPVEPDDPEDTALLPAPDASRPAVERTFAAGSGERYLTGAGVTLNNRTEGRTADIAALLGNPLSWSLGEGPQILIVHTHGSEAYAMDERSRYQETDPARTTDGDHNITRVGAEIARIFTEMGLTVLHDVTLHDYPAYSGSYDRSKDTVQRYLEEHPSIKVVLDVHRDALIGEDGTVYKAMTTIDGVKTAQVLLVVGTDDGGAHHPHWQENLTLALKIQKTLNTLWPTLARPVTLRSSRFNQQLSPGSLLVEIGCHGNTLEEALAGARLFARAAGQVLLE